MGLIERESLLNNAIGKTMSLEHLLKNFYFGDNEKIKTQDRDKIGKCHVKRREQEHESVVQES